MAHSKHLDSLKEMMAPQEAQSRYLVQAIELEETEPPEFFTSLVHTISGLIILSLIWAGVTKVQETAVAEGKIIPENDIQAIQHLEGGIVSEILVHEGDIVKQGDVLMRLSPTNTRAQLDQILARRASTLLEMERFRAIAADRQPDFETQLVGYASLKQDQLAIFINQSDSNGRQKEILQNQLNQQLTEEKRLLNKISALEGEVALLRDELATQKDLYKKGLSTRQSLLAVQREESQVGGAVEEAHDRLNGVRAAIAEAQEKVAEIVSSTKTSALSRVGELNAQLSELDERIKGLSDRAERLDIEAPVAGIIQHLAARAINAVVQPGQTLLEIVPDDELLVEARITPQDIGHVEIGQPVDLKFSTFDFSIYGSVSGTLSRVSATTFQSPKGDYYYRAMITPDRLYVGNNPQGNRLLPGMVAQASINIGEKSILDYLLKPVYRGFSQAFRER
jgi:adhesin transport system membrane fusion protein